jgi:hypothetical protein
MMFLEVIKGGKKMRKRVILGSAFLALAILMSPTSSWVPVVKISTHPDNIDNHTWVSQIAIDPLGNSYVILGGHDGNDWEIYWVRIDSSGIPGTVQKISTHEDNVNTKDMGDHIVVDSSGNSYVAWTGWT